jgi:arylsulfatase A-like enzyme
MKPCSALSLASAGLLLFLLAIPFAHAAVTPRPNIVFIYADDLRWDTLGVVQREQAEAARFSWLQTPQLDALAAKSVRFRESFVVTSLCSPGRAAVMTSRHGHLTGIIGNSAHLPPETITFAQHLKTAGYSTAYFGKWHMRDQRDRPHYDHVASFVGQGRYFDCPFLVNGTETPTKGWVDDVSTAYAIQFVQQQPKGKPFFLWLGFKSPHGPRGGENLPDRVRNLYINDTSRPTPNTSLAAIYNENAGPDGAARKEKNATTTPPAQLEAHRDFMRHVTAIDTAVGRLLETLERTGRAENTLVVFTSDNGYYLGEHGLGDKRSAYDESLRVPLLIRLPGGGSASRPGTIDAMVLNLDYGPTLLDYAGAAPLPGAQGRSLRPLLEGRAPSNWRTAFFYEYFREANFRAPTVLALRTTTHKLITYPGRDDWTEVFDLQRDPFETTNLAKSQTELAEQLQRQLDESARATEFRWPPGFTASGDSPAAPVKAKTGKKKK